jgi:hypothetical protein
MTNDIESEPAIALPELQDNRRVVLEHVRGRLKGILQICGLRSEVEGPMEDYHADVDLGDHRGPASLIGVKRSYWLYREIYKPEKMMGRVVPDAPFDAGQQ